MIIDAEGKKSQFYLSGSQQFQMMKNVSESLAGRLGIANILGLSLREMKGVGCRDAFVPPDDYFANRQQGQAGTARACPRTFPVSIHTPTRGATPAVHVFGKQLRVSTHTPTRGATAAADSIAHTTVSFNPHPHAGGDTKHKEETMARPSFNPHPHAGGDISGYNTEVIKEMFQPTPPRGGRHQRVQHRSYQGDVSTHTPTRGATSASVILAEIKMFQPTPPRGVRPEDGHKLLDL